MATAQRAMAKGMQSVQQLEVGRGVLPPRLVNIGALERIFSMVSGTGLLFLGIRNKRLPGALMALLGGSLLYRGLVGHSELYSLLNINRVESRDGSAELAEKTVTINKSADALYRFWRNFENLPDFMRHLEAVKVIDAQRSHWVARGPLGFKVEWDAEITADEPGKLISWHSLPGSDIDNEGSVYFVPAPGERGTEVKAVIRYHSPAGSLGVAVAKLFNEEPAQQLRDDLMRFKNLMETGEIPTLEGQPSGRK